MKKVFAILLAFVMIFSLCSCGEKSQIRKAQDKIVEIGEQFLDYKLTADEAEDQLRGVVIPRGDGTGDELLIGDVWRLGVLVVQVENGYNTFEDFEAQLEEIKKENYED